MQEIELHALQTFQKNLTFFEANHKALYNKISLLNHLIDEESYVEKYALEYRDNSYFDVLELSSGEFLYKLNSFQHANNIKSLIDKKRSGGVFKGLKRVLATDEQADRIDKSELSFHNYLWASIKIINYTVKYTPNDSYMKRVYKAIFVGTGLGLHIQGIIEKLQSEVIFIQEKNLELFRLSLFVTNYEEISKNRTLFFSILEDVATEQNIFVEFLNKGNNYNLNIKHIPFDDSYKSMLQQFQKYVLSQTYINYGYSPILLRYIESPKYLVQEYNFLNVSKRQPNDVFTKKPTLLLFSGPSTSNNLTWIKENHERFIIISALSTCKLLNSIGAIPDIVIHIDPGEKTSLLFEGIDVKTFFKNTQIFLSANVNQDTINKFEKSQVHVIEQGSKYKKGFGILTSPSVGEYAYALSLILSATEIYMLGIDLALDNETLQTHADFHFGKIQGQQNNDSASVDAESSVSYIKGNLLDQVPSTAAYQLSIQQLDYFTQYYKAKNQNAYNLSNGAYFQDIQPININDHNWNNFPKIDKCSLSTSLHELLLAIGSAEFRNEDKETILYQIKEAKKLNKRILKHQKIKHTNVGKYLNTLAKLFWDLSDMDYKTNSDLAQVYYEYFQTIQSYIFDLFNTMELEKPDKHIQKIDTLLIQQLLKISTLYITKLEGYLK